MSNQMIPAEDVQKLVNTWRQVGEDEGPQTTIGSAYRAFADELATLLPQGGAK